MVGGAGRRREHRERELDPEHEQHGLRQGAAGADLRPAEGQQLFAQAGVGAGHNLHLPGAVGRRPEWITMERSSNRTSRRSGSTSTSSRRIRRRTQATFLPVGKQFPNTIIADFLSLQPNPILGLQFALAGKCECNWNNTTGTQLQQYNQYSNLISAARAQSDPTKRQAIINQLQTMFTQVDPFMVIASQSNLVAQQKNIKGAWVDPRATPISRTPR